MNVAPLAGAWIEIYSEYMDSKQSYRSLPLRERGLKWQKPLLRRRAGRVAPLAGAWIEIIVLTDTFTAHTSLPLRERGLKYLTQHLISDRSEVAPLAGAWIEIAGWASSTNALGRSPCGSVD